MNAVSRAGRTSVCIRGRLHWPLAEGSPRSVRHTQSHRSASFASRASGNLDTTTLLGTGAFAVAAMSALAPANPLRLPILPALQPVVQHALRVLPLQCEEATVKASSAAGSSMQPPVVDKIPEDTFRPGNGSTTRLYQFESCPFCRKVRGCLDYHRIPYEIVEVHPLNKAEVKDFSPDYKKVPIIRIETTDGQQMQLRDSKTIVNALLGSNNPGVAPAVPPPTATPSTGKMWPPTKEPEKATSGTVEEQWVHWTDAVLVQCIVLNVYRTFGESAETFRYLLTHPNFSWIQARSAAWSGTAVMWAVANRRKKTYEVPDVRVALYEAVGSFAAAVRTGGGRFLGGDKPGAVDFNVYGILRSAEACQTERDLLASCADIHPWYDAMNEVVGPSKAVNLDAVKRG
mmetsp:Transcript_59748/g.118388  ORF Transcript_59748/g.118388 Transcript_59748/m.118388 type:complete len:401 (+) Transcript_59748:67-1269(+)